MAPEGNLNAEIISSNWYDVGTIEVLEKLNMNKIIAHPISADFARLGEDITSVIDAGAEWIHLMWITIMFPILLLVPWYVSL